MGELHSDLSGGEGGPDLGGRAALRSGWKRGVGEQIWVEVLSSYPGGGGGG